jgi:AraC family transcriptional regulator
MPRAAQIADDHENRQHLTAHVDRKELAIRVAVQTPPKHGTILLPRAVQLIGFDQRPRDVAPAVEARRRVAKVTASAAGIAWERPCIGQIQEPGGAPQALSSVPRTAMPIAPLPGPLGLYKVSALPRFLLDSSGIGWQGAFFTEIIGAPEGTVDHVHERYCLQRMFTAGEKRRPLGGGGWQAARVGTAIWHAGDEARFDWRGGGRSQFLFVAPERVAELLDGAPRLTRQRDLPPSCLGLLAAIFDALAADLAQRSPGGPLVGDSLIAALVAHLAGLAEQRPPALPMPARERAVAYIDAHFDQPLTLTGLAEAAGVGVRQFCRSFRVATGWSPHQYLLKRRVEHAQTLIAKGQPLAEVALLCGFADQSQLTRTFARQIGCPPARWRATRR